MSYDGPLIGQFHYVRGGVPCETLITTQDPARPECLIYQYPNGHSNSISKTAWKGLLESSFPNRWMPILSHELQVEEGL